MPIKQVETTRVQLPESDLWLPKPAPGEHWHGHTIHTYYLGFCVPEAQIGAFVYVRAQPAMDLCLAGVTIFKGTDNLRPLDCEHSNMFNTLPYPKVEGNRVDTNMGLVLDFIEPGKQIRLTYASPDKKTHFDVLQTGVSPLVARGYVMPGEEHNSDGKIAPGGSEQTMHSQGELVLNGEKHKVDCYSLRDRSWRQVRVEDELTSPPFAFLPLSFGGGKLCFNQVGIEAIDSHPVWEGVFDVDSSKPSFHFAWIVVNGEIRDVKRVRRVVTKYHPTLFAAIEQEMEVEDSKGDTYHFKGKAFAMANCPSWPNNVFVNSFYEWTWLETGETSYDTCQEAWYARYQRFMQGRLEKKPKLTPEGEKSSS